MADSSAPALTMFDLHRVTGFVKKCHALDLDETQASLLLQAAWDNEIEAVRPGFRQELCKQFAEKLQAHE